MSKNNNQSIRTVKEYIRQKALSYLGLIDTNINPQSQSERLTFVNNLEEIKTQKLKEYNVWYSGDSDEIMNFYTRESMIDYQKDPLYSRNKRSYFWSVASSEGDIKRTHSGQPRNIVDTLVNIVGLPKITSTDEFIDKRIKNILDDNEFNRLYMQEQLPLTLIEGWGCYKINYDTYLRDTPILIYYRADSVDFIYKSNQLIAIIFKDYYQDKDKHNYLLFETRRIEKDRANPDNKPKLVIEKDLFKLSQSEIITPVPLTDLPELRDVEPRLEISNYNKFLAVPTIIYKDNNEDTYGRSIYTGKIDLFDDLDQCLSQSANCVRRSTVQEYFNSNYLEKDSHTGLPVMPHSFDRKYVLYNGGQDANGSVAGQTAVQVTQPALNFQQYSLEEQNILLQCISGVMSPATLGIDVAKKDNADAQREKEKVTIFTRNTIIDTMQKVFMELINQLLAAWELMNKGEITCRAYDDILSVKFDEFADASFENKLETLLTAYNSGVMSEELFIEMLYKDQLSDEKKKKEIDFILTQKEQAMAQQQQQQQQPEDEEPPMDEEMLAQLGAELGGMNNNPYDRAIAETDPDNSASLAGIEKRT